VNGLGSAIARVEKSQLAQTQKKVVEDTKKRVDMLFDKMNDGEVPEPAVRLLLDFTVELERGNYEGAMGVHMNLITGNFGDISGSLVGLKRLVELARAAS